MFCRQWGVGAVSFGVIRFLESRRLEGVCRDDGRPAPAVRKGLGYCGSWLGVTKHDPARHRRGDLANSLKDGVIRALEIELHVADANFSMAIDMLNLLLSMA